MSCLLRALLMIAISAQPGVDATTLIMITDKSKDWVISARYPPLADAVQASPGKYRGSQRRQEFGRRAKRSTANVEAAGAKVLAYVKSNPGSRLEGIGRGLGVEAGGLKGPIKVLLAASALRTQGQARGTNYLPGSGKAAAKKAGKRKVAKRGKKAAGRAGRKSGGIWSARSRTSSRAPPRVSRNPPCG